MQIVKARLQFMRSIIIERKNLMYSAERKGASLIRTLSPFIVDYVGMIEKFVILLQKVMQRKRKNYQGEENQIELLNLIRKKELQSIQEWRQMMYIINQQEKIRFNLKNKKFEQIFQKLDKDIQYYRKLKERIQLMIKQNVKNKISKHYDSQKKLSTQTEKYSNLYDHLDDSIERKAGKIKNNVKNQFFQFSSYKFINPNYEKFSSDREKRVRSQLENQMNHALLKHKRYQYKTSVTPKKQILQKKTPEKTVKIRKKYQYLFQAEEDTSPLKNNGKIINNNKTPTEVISSFSDNQEIQGEREKKNSEYSIVAIKDEYPEDSLEIREDKLGNQLQYETRVTITNPQEVNALQKILADSLQSSKQWQLQDSLENIRQTAKFNHQNFIFEVVDEISFGEQ